MLPANLLYQSSIAGIAGRSQAKDGALVRNSSLDFSSVSRYRDPVLKGDLHVPFAFKFESVFGGGSRGWELDY